LSKSKARLALSKPGELGAIKVGSYVLIDDEPCKVVSYEHFKPGKHGSAKVRIMAIGVFTGGKKSYVSQAQSRIDIPMIDKRSGQITSVTDNSVQVMDLETFEVFEQPKPTGEDLAELGGPLAPGAEVEYWSMMGKKKIMRTKGGT
jgi:translation initiation factor 5A